MVKFLFNSRLIEAMQFGDKFGNGFELLHLSNSSDCSEEMMADLTKLWEAVTDDIPGLNAQMSCERLGINHIRFIAGPITAYDSTDWDRVLEYVSEMRQVIRDQRGLAPAA